MVQDRISIESFVAQAWRERWTDLEWGLKLKSLISNDTIDPVKFSDTIIKYATLSEEPNRLMFTYLRYSMAVEVISHVAYLESIMNFRDFHKELCVHVLLGILIIVRDILRLHTLQPNEHLNLCMLFRKLYLWHFDCLTFYLERQRTAAISYVVSSLSNLNESTFVGLCLHFDHLETNGLTNLETRCKELMKTANESTWLVEELKIELRSTVPHVVLLYKDLKIKQDGCSCFEPLKLKSLNDAPQSTVMSIAVLYGSFLMAETLDKVVEAVVLVQSVQRIPWSRVIRDFVRGALLLQQDSCCPIPESHMTAFAYLKVPRVLQQLLDRKFVTCDVLLESLNCLAYFNSLFNSLDMRWRCDCFQYLLAEILKLNLIAEVDMIALIEIRNKEKVNLPDPSPGSQPTVNLVLKAEPTLQTLLNSFHSEFAQNHDKVVKMMHHMISGKSFEYICAAAAVTERLSTFAGKLVEFNEDNKKSTSAPNFEKAEDTVLRSELFDLSFLLLSRIVQLYTYKPIMACESSYNGFFVTWCTKFIDQSIIIGSAENLLPSTDKSTASNVIEVTFKPDNLTVNAGILDRMWQKLKSNQPGWVDDSLQDWSLICMQIPAIGQRLLRELKTDTISAEECKHIFAGLLYVNVNGTHWMCSMLLCLAQWLVAKAPENEEKRKCAAALNNFAEAAVTQSIGERSKLKDRQTFMANVIKRLLSPLLAAEPVPSPPHPWLSVNGGGSWSSSGRQVTPPLQTMAALTTAPSAETVRMQLTQALRQGWLSSAALNVIQRCNRYGQSDVWIRVCLDELPRLVALDELVGWYQLCMACCCVIGDEVAAPMGNSISNSDAQKTIFAPAVALATAICDFVITSGNEVQCAASRGSVSAHLVARSLLLALKLANAEKQPSMKSMEKSSPDRLPVANPVDAVITAICGKFASVCRRSEITPVLYFVSEFMKCLASYNECPEVVHMMKLIPAQLISSVVTCGPDMMNPQTVLALHDLADQQSRRRALRNIFLMHKMRSI